MAFQREKKFTEWKILHISSETGPYMYICIEKYSPRARVGSANTASATALWRVNRQMGKQGEKNREMGKKLEKEEIKKENITEKTIARGGVRLMRLILPYFYDGNMDFPPKYRRFLAYFPIEKVIHQL
jgi:hypothetical protein